MTPSPQSICFKSTTFVISRCGICFQLELSHHSDHSTWQHTFAATGPYAEWEFIGKTSASIPCQRKVKDHVEAEINHYLRGKSHTSPEKENDIRVLQESYRQSKIHRLKPGRKLGSKDTAPDYLKTGSEGTRLEKAMEKWVLNRVDKWPVEEDWTEY